MIVDIILLLILIASCALGYFQGWLKQTYKLIIFILSIFSALFLGPLFQKLIQSNLKILNEIDLPKALLKLVIENISKLAGVILIFIISYLILTILKIVLVKFNVIPKKSEKLKYIGSIILFLKTSFIVTFVLSLLSIVNIFAPIDFYKGSFVAKEFQKLNQPAYNFSLKIKHIYETVLDYENGISIETIKDIKSLGIINDDILIDLSNELIQNLDDFDKETITNQTLKTMIDESGYFNLIKSLIDEKIITERILNEVIKENGFSNINAKEIIDIFE